MILVRDIFQVKFGRMKEVLGLFSEMSTQMPPSETKFRLLTDLVGPYYTLVMESEFENMRAFEESLTREFASEEWRSSYQRVVPLLESGRREIFTIVQ